VGRQYHRPSGVLPCQGGDHIVDPACDRGALEGLTPYTGLNLDVEPGSRQGSHEMIANGITADTPDWRRLWASDALQVRVRAFGAEDLGRRRCRHRSWRLLQRPAERNDCRQCQQRNRGSGTAWADLMTVQLAGRVAGGRQRYSLK
jgi:hypothetical protein